MLSHGQQTVITTRNKTGMRERIYRGKWKKRRRKKIQRKQVRLRHTSLLLSTAAARSCGVHPRYAQAASVVANWREESSTPTNSTPICFFFRRQREKCVYSSETIPLSCVMNTEDFLRTLRTVTVPFRVPECVVFLN